jgi:glycosyltransferase involved in cell wall biosynthesis
LDWVAQKGGLALVIIHPDYISVNGRVQTGEYRQDLIREFLRYVRDRYADQCWFALPKEVAHHVYTTMVPASCVNRRIGARRRGVADSHGARAEPGPPENGAVVRASSDQEAGVSCLQGKRMVAVSFSPFPGDPRPRRAAEAFSNAGMLVDVLCLAEEGLPSKESWKQYCSFLGIVFLKLASRSLRRRYDIVHVHNMPDVLVFAALVPKLLGSKVILDLHDPMPELMRTIFGFAQDSAAVKWMARLEKWSIGFADKVITVNRACEQLFALRSCAPEKVSMIMNAPDEKIFRYAPAREREDGPAQAEVPFVIMYHGTIVERNGLDVAVKALETVLKSVPTAELRIYGPRTPFLDRVMETVADKGLEKSAQYLGPRRLEELVQAIEECDVGVIPNKRSIFTEINTPTRIFEYLALGKPVVAPRAPGIEDYFAEDEMIYFDLGSAEDLARALVWVATHPLETFEITKRGQGVYKEHAWSREREKLLDLGAGLLRKGEKGI